MIQECACDTRQTSQHRHNVCSATTLSLFYHRGKLCIGTFFLVIRCCYGKSTSASVLTSRQHRKTESLRDCLQAIILLGRFVKNKLMQEIVNVACFELNTKYLVCDCESLSVFKSRTLKYPQYYFIL